MARSVAEIFQQPLFVLGDLALQLRSSAVPASVRRMRWNGGRAGRTAFDQAAPFQVVDDGDHRRAVEMGGAGQFALLEVGVGLDDDEHAEQPGRHFMHSRAPGKIAEQGNLGHAQLVADQFRQHAEVKPGTADLF
jgi:hypothetical protein